MTLKKIALALVAAFLVSGIANGQAAERGNTAAKRLDRPYSYSYFPNNESITAGNITVTALALFADGTSTVPSISFASTPTAGFGWSGSQVRVMVGSTTTQSFGGSATNYSITMGGQTIINSPAAATLQLGAAASATPVAQTLQAQGSRGGTDTDVAGANLTIRPGAGTGAATGASLLIQTPTPTTTGSTAQAQATRMEFASGGIITFRTIYPDTTDASALGIPSRLYTSVFASRATLGSKSKALTDGGAVTFATFTIADAAMYSGEVIYNVKAVKGTGLQVLASRVRFTAARVGTNYYVSVSTVGTDTTAVSTGTLSCPISISGTGGVISLVATADTSFASPDSLVGQFRFDSPDAGLTLTFP